MSTPRFRAKGWEPSRPSKDDKCDGCGVTSEFGLTRLWRRGAFSNKPCDDCKLVYVFSGTVAGKKGLDSKRPT